MVIRNNDWYNLNSTRHYPLDDTATGDANGGDLPSNILVDCRIRFPRLAGKFAYIGSVNVTDNLVSVTFLAVETVLSEKDTAAPHIISDFAPLAVVTVVNPDENRPYPIEALYPGVSGWVVFGGGISEPYHGDFARPEQAMLTPSAARWYTGLPIPSVQKEGVADTLTGLVRLKGSNTVSVTAPAEGRTINGITRRAIVIAVRDELGLISLEGLTGPCGKRPESRTCDALPIEYINTVDPDCDGNINIRFIGSLLTTYPYASLSSSSEIPTAGIEIDFGLGVTDACVTQECFPDDTGKLCNDYGDLCLESESSQSLSESSLSLSSYAACDDGALPYGISFDAVTPGLHDTTPANLNRVPDWRVKDDGSRGPISSEDTRRPWWIQSGPLYGLVTESSEAESQGWDSSVSGENSIYSPAFKGGGRAVSIWEGCDYEALTGLDYVDTSRQRRTWTDVHIPTFGMSNSGGNMLAGIVLNYRKSPYTGNPHYMFAGIDTSTSKVTIGKFAGSAWAEISSSGDAALYKDTWYRIVSHVYGVDTASTTMKVRVYEINSNLISNWPNETLCTPVVSMSITTNTFGKISLGSQSTYSYNGNAGLFAYPVDGVDPNVTQAYFSQFNFDKQVE